jgi:putative membrane protein
MPLGESAGPAVADAGAVPEGPGGLQHHANAADQLFAREAVLDALAGLDAARVAATRAQSGPVKQFAARMIDEDAKSRELLMAIAGANHAQVGNALDASRQRNLEALIRSPGQVFDVDYLRNEVAAHQRTAQLYEWIISSGQDPSVRGYAIEVLPNVLEQLEAAQSLLVRMGGRSD